ATGSVTFLSDASAPSTPGFTQTLGALTILNADTITIDKGANVTGGTPIVAFGNTSMNAATTFAIATGTSLNLTGTLANGGFTATFNGGGNATVSGVISGGGGIVMNSTGTLTLSGANTFNGAVNMSSGTITLGNVAGLGPVGSAVLNMTG